MDKFNILTRNFDLREFNYKFGKQEIVDYNYEELDHLMEELPNNDTCLPYKVEIITEDFIIHKNKDNDFKFRYNRIIPFKTNLKSKKKFEMKDIRNLQSNKNEWLKIFLPSFFYWIVNFVLFTYFFILYLDIMTTLVEVDFGTFSVRIYLLWALIFPFVGILLSFKEIYNIIEQKFLIPIYYRNPIEDFIKKNSIIKSVIYFWQLIYLLVYLFGYIPKTNLSIVLNLFWIYIISVIISIALGLNQLIINLKLYIYNKRNKENILDFLYLKIQDPNIASTIHINYIKMIRHLEESPKISFDFITKIISLFSFLIAILPSIINS